MGHLPAKLSSGFQLVYSKLSQGRTGSDTEIVANTDSQELDSLRPYAFRYSSPGGVIAAQYGDGVTATYIHDPNRNMPILAVLARSLNQIDDQGRPFLATYCTLFPGKELDKLDYTLAWFLFDNRISMPKPVYTAREKLSWYEPTFTESEIGRARQIAILGEAFDTLKSKKLYFDCLRALYNDDSPSICFVNHDSALIPHIMLALSLALTPEKRQKLSFMTAYTAGARTDVRVMFSKGKDQPVPPNVLVANWNGEGLSGLKPPPQNWLDAIQKLEDHYNQERNLDAIIDFPARELERLENERREKERLEQQRQAEEQERLRKEAERRELEEQERQAAEARRRAEETTPAPDDETARPFESSQKEFRFPEEDDFSPQPHSIYGLPTRADNTPSGQSSDSMFSRPSLEQGVTQPVELASPQINFPESKPASPHDQRRGQVIDSSLDGKDLFMENAEEFIRRTLAANNINYEVLKDTFKQWGEKYYRGDELGIYKEIDFAQVRPLITDALSIDDNMIHFVDILSAILDNSRRIQNRERNKFIEHVVDEMVGKLRFGAAPRAITEMFERQKNLDLKRQVSYWVFTHAFPPPDLRTEPDMATIDLARNVLTAMRDEPVDNPISLYYLTPYLKYLLSMAWMIRQYDAHPEPLLDDLLNILLRLQLSHKDHDVSQHRWVADLVITWFFIFVLTYRDRLSEDDRKHQITNFIKRSFEGRNAAEFQKDFTDEINRADIFDAYFTRIQLDKVHAEKMLDLNTLDRDDFDMLRDAVDQRFKDSLKAQP